MGPKFRRLSMDELARPTAEAHRAGQRLPIVLVLEDLRSHHNIGALFRTADAFDVERMVLCGITGTPPHRDIHKTALGATESVPWTHEADAVGSRITLTRRCVLAESPFASCTLNPSGRRRGNAPAG